jgi:ElaB/YqjD/DUF883 family membrane-anchored ribosome-binding protein
MGRNGQERESQHELRREAAERRASIKRTAAALEERLRERTDQIAEAFDRTRDQLEGADRLVHKYRYAFLGAAVGLGFALSRRRRAGGGAAAAASPGGTNGIRYVLVERGKPGLLRSLAGGVAALALRQGAEWLLGRMDSSDDEPLLLPPARPPR